MSDPRYCRLEDRGVIKVAGEDATGFLQGIVSNDVNKVTEAHAGYGAFLTPQGKYLFDFFMARPDGDTLLIDCERARLGDFMKRLSMYKLRAKVELSDASDDHAVFALFGGDAAGAFGLTGERGSTAVFADGIVFVDPRLAAAGARAIAGKAEAGALLDGAGFSVSNADSYDRHRLALGLPDSSRDLVVDKSTLMESGFDELGGIDWNKGCYMGQEVTARMKHRGLVKKRLLPVVIDGAAPEAGTPVMADGREVGELRSSSGDRGLALLKLDAVDGGAQMSAGDARVTPERPSWANL